MKYHPPAHGSSYSAHDYEGHSTDYSMLEGEANKLEYDLQEKYMSDKKNANPFSQDYQRHEEEDKAKDSADKNTEEEERMRKYGKKEDKEESLRKVPGPEINEESGKAGFKEIKKEKTIEDAIRDAIKREKEVII